MNGLTNWLSTTIRNFKLMRQQIWHRGNRRIHRKGSVEQLESRVLLARDLLVASADTDSILRFDGDTGAAKGVFVASGSGGLVNPLSPTFGPDGNLYVISNDSSDIRVLKYSGTSGAFLSTFIDLGTGSASDIQLGVTGIPVVRLWRIGGDEKSLIEEKTC